MGSAKETNQIVQNPKANKPRGKVAQGRKIQSAADAERKSVQERTTQIQGFAQAIHCWLRTQIGLKSPFVPIAKHLDETMSQTPIEDLPKHFKLLITTAFSRKMDQDMPEGSEQVEGTWPWPVKSRYHGALTAYMKRPLRRKRSCWALLQCKNLANTVPFIAKVKAYEKHHVALSEVRTTDPTTLEEFRYFIQPWLVRVRECYTTNTQMAKPSACCTRKRSDGGLKASLRKKVQHKGHLTVPNRKIRMEPVVISLVGDPGVGKSRAFRQITENIAVRFGKCTKEPSGYAYWRSIATDHWDGYRNQLFAGIDDFGGQIGLCDADEIPPEKLELLQTVSTVDCVLPMADLKSKGRKFTSEFLGLSMNMRALCCSPRFADAGAYWRRVGKPVWVMQNVTKTHCNLLKVVFSKTDEEWNGVIGQSDLCRILVKMGFTGHPGSPAHAPHCMARFMNVHKSTVPKIISDWALSKWEEKNAEELSLNAVRFQPFSSCKEFEVGFGYEFDIPSELPLNRVGVLGLCEPLKVRMITKPQPLAWALKPLQIAMFKALKSWQCFEPCWNPDFDPSRIINSGSQKGLSLLSGDYSAATDGLHMDVSLVASNALAEFFETIDPQIARLIRWEGGVHTLDYPILSYTDDNGKKVRKTFPPVIQSNGQLMGSLLSFPILCLVNAFTYARAHNLLLHELDRVLIHGDDICFQSDADSISLWKELANSVGLKPSVGKNYAARDWVSIDSKLFVKKKNKLEEVQTGKFKCLVRTARQTDTFETALKSGFTPNQVRYYSAARLKETPRSLNIPVCYGGLGDKFRREEGDETIRDRLIYIYEKRKRCRVVPTKQTLRELRILKVPLFAAKELKIAQVRLKVEEDQLEWEDPEERDQLGAEVFPHREFDRFQKWAHKEENNQFFRCVARLDLKRERPLTLYKSVTVVVQSDFEFARLNNLVEREFSRFHSIGEKSNKLSRIVDSVRSRRRRSSPKGIPAHLLTRLQEGGRSSVAETGALRATRQTRTVVNTSTSESEGPTDLERWNNPLVYGSTLSLLNKMGPR